MGGLVRMVLVLAGFYLAYAALIFFFQRFLLYPGAGRTSPESPAPRTPEIDVHRIPFSSGEVEAWYLGPRPVTASAAPAVIWFHGNGELIDDNLFLVEGMRELGLGVLLVEYPGYGRSSGRPSESTIREASLAGYELIAARPDVDSERIIVFGRSLGAGAACAVVARRKIAALILQSPFTSVRPFAKRYAVPGFLARDVFDNVSVVAGYDGPVLILHGRFDSVVPYAHGVELAGAARNAQLVTYDCDHNDFPYGELAGEVGTFLREQGILPSPERDLLSRRSPEVGVDP